MKTKAPTGAAACAPSSAAAARKPSSSASRPAGDTSIKPPLPSAPLQKLDTARATSAEPRPACARKGVVEAEAPLTPHLFPFVHANH